MDIIYAKSELMQFKEDMLELVVILIASVSCWLDVS